jgi:hypothetical protein
MKLIGRGLTRSPAERTSIGDIFDELENHEFTTIRGLDSAAVRAFAEWTQEWQIDNQTSPYRKCFSDSIAIQFPCCQRMNLWELERLNIPIRRWNEEKVGNQKGDDCGEVIVGRDI